jgi:DNA-directed RNA polymerase subunit H
VKLLSQAKSSGGRGFKSRPVHSYLTRKMKVQQVKIDISKHSFVPKHIKLTEEEVQEVLITYNISIKQLPSIKKSDPSIRELNAKPGDVIKIVRNSETAGEYPFYRAVING